MYGRGRTGFIGCLAAEVLENASPELREALIKQADGGDASADELCNVFELRPQRPDDRPSGVPSKRRGRVRLEG